MDRTIKQWDQTPSDRFDLEIPALWLPPAKSATLRFRFPKSVIAAIISRRFQPQVCFIQKKLPVPALKHPADDPVRSINIFDGSTVCLIPEAQYAW
jgi:hypothetical protein